MISLKSAAIRVIESLPEDCTMEDILYRLNFIEKIEKARKEIANGEVLSEEEADREIDQWLQSSGADQP
jgi:hypothetical protein